MIMNTCMSALFTAHLASASVHEVVTVAGVSSSQVAVFLLNTPMIAWDPNADPFGKRRQKALKNHGDTGMGRWEVNALGVCEFFKK